MKKIIALITSSIVLILLALLIFLPKKEFSLNENRYLEKFPSISIKSILNGKYMSKIESYVEDHFPYRESFLNLKTNIYKFFGMTKQNDVYFGEDNYLLQEYNKPKNTNKIIKKINEFSSNLKDVEINFMLVPTSIYVNKDKLPTNNLTYNQKKVIKEYKDNLNIEFINVTNTLVNNKDKYLYYKTDHHWTTYGAYYAYLEYCNKKGIEPNNYEFTEVSSEFKGTLYSKILDNSTYKDTIVKVEDKTTYEVKYVLEDKKTNTMYEEKYLKEKDKYAYFLDGNHALITIENIENNNDYEILIIKDSYANSFIPLITQHYKKIHIIDPRYYLKSTKEYIENNNIKEVLFLYNVLSIDEDLGILNVR